ncbi:nitrilase and fragile histidine triad fusion protein NitFhit isoform X1 [Bradysia coprophila]|uniref:nitrilase and fragile histidine triad fusion protein NitFhit isoform X1 n=2 Tax=Bradysia coprophila TaxID=38358 RepID=UPI00187DD843|nr:nitrilase and fragile histidine triad fusion protein NitFhit isoform X1 [Bradysia coprophila]XP_037032685.1 nitrilase and fragile histidine triad fusion protein NitFhit isoform X1 [Bradysia coprophila]
MFICRKYIGQSACKRLTIIRRMSTEANSKSNRIAICHMRSTNDPEKNRSQVTDIVQKAKELNANFIFLPECCDYVGGNVPETLKLSQTIDGDTMSYYKNLSKSNKVWLSIGGFHEKVPKTNDSESDKIFNSHVIVNDEGGIVGNYRKLHLFDVDTPEFKFRESKIVEGGRSILAPIPSPIGNVGVMICYDLRFPELSTLLRKQGAEILTYPSAFAYTTGEAHWETLLRARAIENQCFVVASAQIGYHNEKRRSYGNAMVVNPWGKIIAKCDNDKDVDVAVADIDLQVAVKVRQNMPCLEHRRNDIYSLSVMPEKFQPSTTDFVFEKYPIPVGTIFYQSNHSLAFTNIRCVVPGHVLVASRRPANRLKDLTPEEVTDFFRTVCLVQKMSESYHQTCSATVTVQDGEFAGQTVKHLHCHIMPRRKGDFKFNDEIYVKLAQHDAHNQDPSTRRSNEEMCAEASEYRKLFASKNFD